MAEIILHQYVNSPFSEKIRKIFAHKKISWRAVEQPVIMPKPKLIPLTGGYRQDSRPTDWRGYLLRYRHHHPQNR